MRKHLQAGQSGARPEQVSTRMGGVRSIMQRSNKIMRYLVAALLICLVELPAQAQETDTPPQNYVDDVTNAGTSAAAFLQIGVGARAQAMGNAAMAMSNDPTALFWNPAALTGMEGTVHVAFDHTGWLAGTQLDFVGVGFSMPGVGVVGLSVLSFQMVEDQPVRTVDQPEGTGEFYNASDLALGATYAVALTDRFSAGLTGKYVRESLWNETASALAVDLGITYRTRLPGLFLAAGISNFGGDMKMEGRDLMRPYDDDPGNFSNDQLNASLDTDEYSLPLYFRFGLGYNVKAGDLHSLTLAADLLHPSDNTEAVNMGAEYTFWNTLSLRGGLVSVFEQDRTGGATYGVGVQRRFPGGMRLAADYARANWGLLDNTNRITITLSR